MLSLIQIKSSLRSKLARITGTGRHQYRQHVAFTYLERAFSAKHCQSWYVDLLTLLQLYFPILTKATEGGIIYRVIFCYMLSQASHLHCNWLILRDWICLCSAVLSSCHSHWGGNSPFLPLEWCVVHMLHENTHVGRNVGVSWVSAQRRSCLTSDEHTDISYYGILKPHAYKRKLLPTETCELAWFNHESSTSWKLNPYQGSW